MDFSQSQPHIMTCQEPYKQSLAFENLKLLSLSWVAGAPAWCAVVPEELERSRLQPSPRDDPPAHLQTPAKVYTLCGQSRVLLFYSFPDLTLKAFAH